jgi:hypothetical protein
MSGLIALLIFSIFCNVIMAQAVIRHKIGPDGRTDKQIESDPTPKPVCGCKHDLAFHGPDGCEQYMILIDGRVMQKSYKCRCQKYTGPVPLTQYFDDQLSLES